MGDENVRREDRGRKVGICSLSHRSTNSGYDLHI